MVAIQLPWSGDPVLKMTENLYIQGPNDSFAAPGTHFRHDGTANVGFLDGHVEGMRQVDAPYPSSWSAAAGAMAQLPFACGLGTGALLADDLVAVPSIPDGGVLPVGRVLPDLDRLLEARERVSTERVAFWRARIESAWHAVPGLGA